MRPQIFIDLWYVSYKSEILQYFCKNISIWSLRSKVKKKKKSWILKLTCSDSEPGFIAGLPPGGIAGDAAVRTLILLGHLQNLEHAIRKGNEPVESNGKAERKKVTRLKFKQLLFLTFHKTQLDLVLWFFSCSHRFFLCC